MDDLDRDALAQLKKDGFTDIKIVGRSGDRILYMHTNGDPVMDGPVAIVTGDRVDLKPWMDFIE